MNSTRNEITVNRPRQSKLTPFWQRSQNNFIEALHVFLHSLQEQCVVAMTTTLLPVLIFGSWLAQMCNRNIKYTQSYHLGSAPGTSSQRLVLHTLTSRVATALNTHVSFMLICSHRIRSKNALLAAEHVGRHLFSISTVSSAYTP